MDDAIEARGMVKTYRGDVKAHEGEPRRGEGRGVGLLGPNGAGKSTTVRS